MKSPYAVAAPRLVVMGITGCGKSEVGSRLASALGSRFIEGDQYHSDANRQKMAAGIALSDEDRWGWLDDLGKACRPQLPQPGFVLACSALRRVYRDRLRAAVGGGLHFVFLDTPHALSYKRLGMRAGHFMPASLVDSQLATLEPPAGEPGVVTVSADQALDDVVALAMQGLSELAATDMQRPMP